MIEDGPGYEHVGRGNADLVNRQPRRRHGQRPAKDLQRAAVEEARPHVGQPPAPTTPSREAASRQIRLRTHARRASPRLCCNSARMFCSSRCGIRKRSEDEQRARQRKNAKPEGERQDYQQLHDLRQRDVPRRIESVAQRDARHRCAEIVTEGVGDDGREGDACPRDRHPGEAERQIVEEKQHEVVDDSQPNGREQQVPVNCEQIFAKPCKRQPLIGNFWLYSRT